MKKFSIKKTIRHFQNPSKVRHGKFIFSVRIDARYRVYTFLSIEVSGIFILQKSVKNSAKDE